MTRLDKMVRALSGEKNLSFGLNAGSTESLMTIASASSLNESGLSEKSSHMSAERASLWYVRSMFNRIRS